MPGAVDFNEQFFRDLLVSAPVRDLVVEAAERIAATARSTAPVDTGDYRGSIRVEVKYQKRVVAMVVADDPKTMLIESKTGNLVRALNRNKRSRG